MKTTNKDQFDATDRSGDRGGRGRTIPAAGGDMPGALRGTRGAAARAAGIRCRRSGSGIRSGFSVLARQGQCRKVGIRKDQSDRQVAVRGATPLASNIRPEKIEQARRIALYTDAELGRLLDAAMDRILEAMIREMNSRN